MNPRNDRLLFQARRALAGLRARVAETDRATIDDIDIVLNELALRTSDDFYLADYRAGRALAVRGVATLAAGAAADAVRRMLAEAPETVADDIHPEQLYQHRRTLVAVLSQVVHLNGRGDEAARAFAEEAAAWDAQLLAHRMTSAGEVPQPTSIDSLFTPERIETYLAAHLPDSAGLKITKLHRLPGGFSKTTVLLDIADPRHGARSVVLRIEPPVATSALDTQRLEVEYPIVRIAYDGGLPVPEPLLIEPDAKVLGLPFSLAVRVSGENYGSVAGTTKPISPQIVAATAKLLAGIGRVPLEGKGGFRSEWIDRWATLGSTAKAAEALVDYWLSRGTLRNIDPSPIVTMGYDWLKANIPDYHAPPVLVHGDFGLHNTMFEHGAVTALLDWEAAYAGDPAGDLSNLLFGTDGKLDRAALLDHYHAAGGVPVSPYRLAYYDVFNAFKMTVGSMGPLYVIDEEDEAPISFAVLGLRYAHFVAGRLPTLIRTAERIRDESGGA